MVIDGDWLEYTGSVMAIDPSGRGQDETSFSIVKVLNGFMYVHECAGIAGGYGKEVLEKLAHEAKRHKVNLILVESNFGDGMFLELLKQHLRRIYPVTTEEVRHHVQKNKRIVDTLEPVMNQHKLVVSPKLIESDYESTLSRPPEKQNQYRLFWQMTRCTRERGSLIHDDRLDVLSMAVSYWVEAAGRSAAEEMNSRREELLQKELDAIMNTRTFGEQHKPDTWM